MGLVTAKEVAKAINVDKYGVLGTFSGWMLMKLLKISTLNKVYDRNRHLKDVAFLNGILDDLQIKFEIPEEMTEDEVNRLVREFGEKLQYQGLKLEDYLKYCNTTMDDFKATLKDEANKRIGYRLIVDAVVEKEKLEITDKELEDGLKEAAEKYGMSVEDFEKEIGSKELFKYDLLMRKAMEIVTK